MECQRPAQPLSSGSKIASKQCQLVEGLKFVQPIVSVAYLSALLVCTDSCPLMSNQSTHSLLFNCSIPSSLRSRPSVSKVREASVVRDPLTKVSRGFAFVVMSNASEADDAVRNLHHTQVDGRSISVELVMPLAPSFPSFKKILHFLGSSWWTAQGNAGPLPWSSV